MCVNYVLTQETDWSITHTHKDSSVCVCPLSIYCNKRLQRKQGGNVERLNSQGQSDVAVILNGSCEMGSKLSGSVLLQIGLEKTAA